MLIHSTQLRSVYKFYSRLGRSNSPHGAFLLTRLQLWRLLKDCKVHHHDISLIQIDHFIQGKDDRLRILSRLYFVELCLKLFFFLSVYRRGSRDPLSFHSHSVPSAPQLPRGRGLPPLPSGHGVGDDSVHIFITR